MHVILNTTNVPNSAGDAQEADQSKTFRFTCQS